MRSTVASRPSAPSLPAGLTLILLRTDGGGVAGRRCGPGCAERPSTPQSCPGLGGTGRAQRRAPGLSDWRRAGGGEPRLHRGYGDTDTGDPRHRASAREAKGRAGGRAARRRLLKGDSGLTIKDTYVHIGVCVYLSLN